MSLDHSLHCVQIKPQNHYQENPKAKLIWIVLEGGQIHFGCKIKNEDRCNPLRDIKQN